MKITIGKKLWAMTLLLFAIFIVLGMVAYERVQRINSTLKNIIDNEVIQSEASHEMEIQINRMGIGLLGYLLNEDPEHLNRINNGSREFSEAQKKYQELCTTNQGTRWN